MDFADLAQEYGVANLRFFIPMHPLEYIGFIPGIAFKSSNTQSEVVECVVDESFYKVRERYKIKLCAVDKRYGTESYYQSDLRTLLHRRPDTFKVYVIDIDGYTRIPNSIFDWRNH